MKDYESIFIVRPSISDEGVKEIVEKFKKIIEKSGGSITKTEQWGKRRMAYEVKKERKGSYSLIQLKGNGSVISDLERNYLLDDSVIKYLTVRLEHPVAPNQETSEKPLGETREG